MWFFENVLLAIGGITFFVLGLKFMSQNMENLTGKSLKKFMQSCTKNEFSSLLTGAISTSLVQSSVATNIITISFVSNGIISFYNSCAVIMGTNIGTTITAQLVALSNGRGINITAISSFIAFIGLLLSFSRKNNLSSIGNVLIGFGLLFVGLDIVKRCISVFKNYEFFCNVFLVKDSVLLLLNGIFITAIVQSSSVVSSVIILLASNGVLSFENSMFLILGSNIGTCFPVIIASMNKSLEGRRTAFFNLAFNLLGTAILFVPLLFLKSQVASVFMGFSGGIERSIANFHTLFNVLISLILLPILKPFAKLICYLVKDEKVKTPKKYPFKMNESNKIIKNA